MEPCISGHEGTGFVVGIGEQLLPGKGVQIGDRVGVKFVAETCMRCEACEGGQENVCNSVSGRTGELGRMMSDGGSSSLIRHFFCTLQPKISGINSPGTCEFEPGKHVY